jgi:GTPase SAR1 family protein
MVPSDQEDYHYRFKVVILGDNKTGKTTFLDSKYLYKHSINTKQWQNYRNRVFR